MGKHIKKKNFWAEVLSLKELIGRIAEFSKEHSQAIKENLNDSY